MTGSLGRILILGAAGQVGQELGRSFAGSGEILSLDRTAVDLADEGRLRELVRCARPDVILNAAAYTAVDRAESEPDLAMAINGRAPGVLAEEAARGDALLVHYSTDYVFDGARPEPWVETDPPNPLNVYGRSKLAGEEAIERAGGRYLILRTSWVYGPHGGNFLLTMLRLGRECDRLSIVDDQIGAPTTSIALAGWTRYLVGGALAGEFGSAREWSGLYHLTSAGSTSWFGFAGAIFAEDRTRQGGIQDAREGEHPARPDLRPGPEIVPIPSSQYPTPARRPLNSVLSNAKIRARFGLEPLPWEAALAEVMDRMRDDPAVPPQG